MKMMTICDLCGVIIYRKPSQIMKRKNRYCSKNCHNASMKKGHMIICGLCGKQFYRPPSKINSENLCSVNCRKLWLGKRNLEIINVAGHSQGHKAPHLSIMNKLRHPINEKVENLKNVKSIGSHVYRKIVETHIGRKLQKGEVVHHINGNRTDNRIENLQIMNRRTHGQLHMKVAYENYTAMLMRGGDVKMSKEEALSKGVALLME